MISPPDTLDLQSAADELGVHYQTAYRWVRSGRLPARLVAGRYLVDRDALRLANEARLAPTPPRAPSTQRLGRQSSRMLDALRAGDETAASEIVRRLAKDGAPVTEVIQQLFVPALRQIGDEWHAGTLPISVEHRASAIVERLLGLLAPNPPGRRRGTAVVVALEGDRHSLPTSMAAVALREDLWHVHHLGADMPVEELLRFCADHDIDVIVISATTSEAQERAADTAADLRRSGTATIVGAPGRSLADLRNEARAALVSSADLSALTLG